MSRISMVRGTTHVIEIALRNKPDGSPYLLGDDAIVRFGVKRCLKDKTCILQKEIGQESQDENGICTLVLDPGDTINLCCGTYRYDIGLQEHGTYDILVEDSEFTLRGNVTTYKEVSNA